MSPKLAMKMHDNPNGSVLAIADAELIGKTLTEGVISFNVSKLFYHERIVDEKELEWEIEQANNINIVGENAFKFVQQKGLASEKSIRRIAGVPHAQIYKL